MMEDLSGVSQTAISIVQGGLIASLQGDLNDEVLTSLRQDVLYKVHSMPVTAVIFDMSVVRALDTYAFAHLMDTAKMTQLLGAESFFVGFQPGVVSFLVDMDVDTTTIPAFLTLEDGLTHMTALSSYRKYREDVRDDTPMISEYDGQEGSIDEQE